VDAEQCFAKLPSTDIALQTTVYYYSLQIASSLDWHGDNDEKNCLSGVYRTSPGSLSTAVVTYISWALSDPVVGTQMSASVHQMALRLMHYNCRLIELTQAQALRRLDRGEFVDTNINTIAVKSVGPMNCDSRKFLTTTTIPIMHRAQTEHCRAWGLAMAMATVHKKNNFFTL